MSRMQGVLAGWLVLSLGGLSGAVQTVSAQEEELQLDFSSGVVKELAEGRLTISEFDWEAVTEADVTYQVAPDVELTNVDSLDQIAPGDEVEIDYVTTDQGRVAKAITVNQGYEE